MAGVTTSYQTGVHASRPAAGAGCILYSCTTHGLIYRSDGTTWTTFLTMPGAPSGSITASGYTQNTAKLLGRTTASAGAIEEISIGSGLSMSAGSLSATGGSSLTTIDAPASGDTTQVNANTFYDAAGVSASFPAGTYAIFWTLLEQVIVGTGQSYVFTVRVWDGTTTYHEVEITAAYTSTNVNGFPWLISGSRIIVVGSTATLKLSAASIRGSSASKIARDVPDNGSSNHTATQLSAVKVA